MTTIPAKFISSRTIAAAVEKVLARPQMTEKARQLSRWAADNDGAEKAAVEIESFIAAR